MDIEIETRFQITVVLVDANGDVVPLTSTMTGYWAWAFWDGTFDKITGVIDVTNQVISFEVPDDFFNADRIYDDEDDDEGDDGEGTANNIIVVDSSGVPVYKSLPAYDRIVQHSPTLEQIGL